MKKSLEIQKQINALADRVEAIHAVAKDENRDLNEAETKEVNDILGDGEKTGQADALQAQLKTVKAQEDKMNELARARLTPIVEAKIADGEGTGKKKITVPAVAKRYTANKAIWGNDGEVAAYSAGQFYAANVFGSKRASQWCREHGVIKASQSEGDTRRGGVFVPIEVETAIIRLVEQYGVFRRFAKVESMMSDRKVVPVRVSGLTAYAASESNTANQSSNTTTETDIDYTTVELVARKWKVTTRVSDELNEDALISMANEITTEMALAFAYSEDNSGFNGDGTSTYHGIYGLKNCLAAGAIYDCITGNTAFGTLDLDDFEAALAKLPAYPNMQPAWFISKAGYYASMARLAYAAGGNTTSDIANGTPLQFMGLPVVFTQVLLTALTAQTSTICAYVGDLKMSSLFGDRRGMKIVPSSERYWDVDQVGIKGSIRMDIVNHSRGSSSAAGAVVAMKFAAS